MFTTKTTKKQSISTKLKPTQHVTQKPMTKVTVTQQWTMEEFWKQQPELKYDWEGSRALRSDCTWIFC
jgi:hypothetical protein